MNGASPDGLLSVVVALVSDTTDGHCDLSHLAGCLEALAGQVGAPPLEIIVPYPASLTGMEEIRRRFPGVVLLPCADLKTYTGRGGSREHHDELRACGLAVARGDLLGLVEDHVRPDPHWAAAMTEMHRGPYAAVVGAMDNSVDRALNWAVYFCDFGKYQNPLPEGEAWTTSDANTVYKRAALESIRPLWQDRFQEAVATAALLAANHKLAQSPRAIIYQHRTGLRLWPAMKERFIWARSYAIGRSKTLKTWKRLVYAMLTPILPPLLLYRMGRNVVRRRRYVGTFARAFPLTSLLALSWSVGELCGYLGGNKTQAAEDVDELSPPSFRGEPREGVACG
jgi:hypothetical protein